jgi:hypothetical protein
LTISKLANAVTTWGIEPGGRLRHRDLESLGQGRPPGQREAARQERGAEQVFQHGGLPLVA